MEQETGMNASRPKRATVGVLLLWSCLATAAENDPSLDILGSACKESSACRAYVGLSDWNAKVGILSEHYKKKIVEFFSPSSKARTQEEYLNLPIAIRQANVDSCIKDRGKDSAGFCREQNLTESELSAWERQNRPVRQMVWADADAAARNVYSEDEKINTGFRLSCSTPEEANSGLDYCVRLIRSLNDLERKVARLNADTKEFRYYHPEPLSLAASGTAGRLGVPRSSPDNWDESYRFDAQPASSGARVAAAAVPVISTRPDIAPPDSGDCDRQFAKDFSLSPDAAAKGIAEFKARVMSDEYLRANENQLERSVADIEKSPGATQEQRWAENYQVCLYRLRVAQLRKPRSAILRRDGDTGAAVMQASLESSQEWERDRPRREAEAKAQEAQTKAQLAAWAKERVEREQQERQEQAALAQAQEQRRQKEAHDQGVADALADAVTALAGVYVDAKRQQTANAQASETKCIASADLCNDIRLGLPPGTTERSRRR
jgi:hypothetical protein